MISAVLAALFSLSDVLEGSRGRTNASSEPAFGSDLYHEAIFYNFPYGRRINGSAREIAVSWSFNLHPVPYKATRTNGDQRIALDLSSIDRQPSQEKRRSSDVDRVEIETENYTRIASALSVDLAAVLSFQNEKAILKNNGSSMRFASSDGRIPRVEGCGDGGDHCKPPANGLNKRHPKRLGCNIGLGLGCTSRPSLLNKILGVVLMAIGGLGAGVLLARSLLPIGDRGYGLCLAGATAGIVLVGGGIIVLIGL
ncbi:hypothetical protein [Sphingomonas sp. SRS2]|uniref:hypothetical protein n=1 Tax=Sphingomonas sp. SRS2 TaxID=133190 RepID=UPI000A4FAC32|nr:hypothetical protein [Sphingomonas sp. SRS2]